MIRLLFLVLGAFLAAQAKVLVYPFDAPVFPENVNEGNLDPNNGRIIDGVAAVLGEIPYQLYLRMVTTTGDGGACGGSLIHPQWGLTAAHCTAGISYLIVRPGVIDLTSSSLEIETNVWYNHPDYNPNNLNNDLSLIDLKTEVKLSDYIRPIRLQRSYQTGVTFQNDLVTASGFGRTVDGGPASNTLNLVTLRVISKSDCAEIYGTDIIIESTICAVGNETASQNTCQGDSGGPLTLLESDGIRTLVGVVSFGSGVGCSVGNPSGYVRPGFFHEWFTNVTDINFNQL